MAAAFISYRREDAAGYAGRLRESLERRIGEARVFRDVDTLQPGQDFVHAIETRLRECRVMLAIIGREWVDARGVDGQRRLDDPYDFVRLEIAAGLARPDVLLVPVLVEGAMMPPASALPEAIRPLARRHAVTVRDETWDADIERLAAIINGTAIPSPGAAGSRRHRVLAAALVGGAVVAGGLAVARWIGPADVTRREAEAPAAAGVDPTPAPVDAPYTIDVPRVAEAAFQQLTYGLVSGNVVFRATGPELRLRIRLSNEGRTPINFWDDSFRLVAGSQVLSPTSGLNVVMAGHSLGYGIVTFALPASRARAVLQIRQSGSVAEIPLDLASTGRPPVDDLGEIADSLSQALIKSIIGAPESLIDSGGLSVTIERSSRRKFANTVRFRVALRIRNRGRTPRFSGDLIVRAVAGSETVAPWDVMGAPIAPDSTMAMDATFDLPPGASSATLRAVLDGVTRERIFDLR